MDAMTGGNHSHQHQDLPEVRSGCLLAALSLLLLVAIVHGVLAFGCYLVSELRRLSYFEAAAIWLGDAIGLYWFLRYAVRWQLGLIECEPRILEDRRLPKMVWVMMISMGVGFLGELAMALLLTREEYTGFHRAVPAVCLVEKIQGDSAPKVARFWKIDGVYEDDAGDSHRVTYYLHVKDDLPLLPGNLAGAIRNKQAGLQLPIVYDPEHPSRSWIEERGWDDGNRLHYFSFLILLFQFLIMLLFLVLLNDRVKQYNQLPWWTELHCLIPLGAQAFILALFGGLELYIVRRFCP